MRLQDVSKTYDLNSVSVNALVNISINVMEGEFIAILGPSGSGKSTLLHLIGALDLPTEGEIFINNIPVSIMRRNELAKLRQRIGFVFQNLNLVPRFTALQNVELAMTVQGDFSHRIRKQKALELLSFVGLSDRVKHKNNELSGGEQQRVAIARALGQEPFFLLLDEPTGNVDTTTRDELMSLIRKIHDAKGITTIMVTHDQEIAQKCERILHLVDGQIIDDTQNGEKMT
ncbi:putative ABC transporter ATP-binding protein [Candidatus Lokiarchaeum ossiferum]|uniref:ABC transporter ATP-binding protein n=1 Tax=Candidatus Lokiarchaeum ossiferum TaxID=2951803 RepID=A0ABY6HMW8_9ARCH|nr:putative ABC transporter ATP-binding protein [Candidatus Lokiarchaeum sp. B-35]